jgi:hypothetical protein
MKNYFSFASLFLTGQLSFAQNIPLPERQDRTLNARMAKSQRWNGRLRFDSLNVGLKSNWAFVRKFTKITVPVS